MAAGVDRLLIHCSGALRGSVHVNGAKNACLPIMAACLLTEEPSVIDGVPRVSDVGTMADILRRLGVEVTLSGPRLSLKPDRYEGYVAPYEVVSRMRASVCVLGPLLAKQGKAQVAMPGGCVIGARPIDLHLKGLRALGASISIEHGYIAAHAKQLRGAKVHLAGPAGSSVLATVNVMMAASLARGTTIIEHAACEPEVVDLANLLIAMGAQIEGHGGSVIRIEGVKRLKGVEYKIIPDRIEAGTFMIAAALLGGDLQIRGARLDHLGAVIDKLSEAEIKIERLDDALRVIALRPVRAVNVTTLPYPGFPTDLQAPMTALLSVSRGVSLITDKIYPERFMHVPELNRMGAQISREGPSAIVQGVNKLSGAPVIGSDLRATAALLLAGMAADNQTDLRGLAHLKRGYQDLIEQLVGLGARIQRLDLGTETSRSRRGRAEAPRRREARALAGAS